VRTLKETRKGVRTLAKSRAVKAKAIGPIAFNARLHGYSVGEITYTTLRFPLGYFKVLPGLSKIRHRVTIDLVFKD
jgi:hypothetical protein